MKHAHDRAVLEWRRQISEIAEEVREDIQQAARDSVPAHVVEDDEPGEAGDGNSGFPENPQLLGRPGQP
ncbi:hypothetical protein LWF01_16670 [Saxibacter everestensis]|uniref:Uncharacterized protein n=1 Tax=Saxibacter everestensis TaxID=2909229 RepID=A0ABY8QS92_9MICO|nr:hypothetical protein LWF01_16670 [Brevibacteriaceae bacterium ZFBP1038]